MCKKHRFLEIFDPKYFFWNYSRDFWRFFGSKCARKASKCVEIGSKCARKASKRLQIGRKDRKFPPDPPEVASGSKQPHGHDSVNDRANWREERRFHSSGGNHVRAAFFPSTAGAFFSSSLEMVSS